MGVSRGKQVLIKEACSKGKELLDSPLPVDSLAILQLLDESTSTDGEE